MATPGSSRTGRSGPVDAAFGRFHLSAGAKTRLEIPSPTGKAGANRVVDRADSAMNLKTVLKDFSRRRSVRDSAREHASLFDDKKGGSLDARTSDYQTFITRYYDLVTDLYEYGWGRSFHFAPRSADETFAASLARHEHYLAYKLGLRPDMRVADLGCRIGGSLHEIVRFCGATIVGFNINPYQVERARSIAEEAGLDELTEYVVGDFMDIRAPDASFDAVYSIEATCCAPDKAGVYGEAYRILKPGGCFATYEYCLTDLFNADDPGHQRIKRDIEVGGGLIDIDRPHEIDAALETVGFDVLEARDMALPELPGIPWYEPLAGSAFSLAGFRRSSLGRRLIHRLLQAMETLGLVPAGTVRVNRMLNIAADGFVAAGRRGIFTPMYFFLARKPESVHEAGKGESVSGRA